MKKFIVFISLVFTGLLFMPACDGGSSGSADNSYKIYTADDLNAVRGGVTGYEDWDLSGSYKLMADIDLTGTDYVSGEGWVPLGSDTGSFGGTFDGNDHTISGLSINRPGSDYQGLFGYIGGTGTVKNLTVQGTVSGRTNVGGLAGASEGTVNSCVSEVDVTGADGENYNTGGLIGYTSGGSVSNSSASGAVIGSSCVGGLLGTMDAGTLSSCHASGAVTSLYDTAGGLVGSSDGGSISNSYATGAVEAPLNYVGGLVAVNISGTIGNCHAEGTVSGKDYVGGLAGDSNGPISQSYATGAVTGTGNYIGGLAGSIYAGNITGSYATGNVTANASSSNYVGGFAGWNEGGSISGCHAVNIVTGYDYVGGFAGYNNTGSINRSYASYAGTQGTSPYSDSVNGHGYVGGFAGYNNGGSIIECYSYGNADAAGIVGGFIGRIESGVVRYCYSFGNSDGNPSGGFIGYLITGTVEYCYSIGVVTGSTRGGFICNYTTISGAAYNYYAYDRANCTDTHGATGILASELQTTTKLEGWDFSTVWNLTSANWYYPHLRNNLPSF